MEDFIVFFSPFFARDDLGALLIPFLFYPFHRRFLEETFSFRFIFLSFFALHFYVLRFSSEVFPGRSVLCHHLPSFLVR